MISLIQHFRKLKQISMTEAKSVVAWGGQGRGEVRGVQEDFVE